MSWIEDLARGTPPVWLKYAEIADGAPFRISWDGGDPQEPLWSDNFDLVLSSYSLDELKGRKVLVFLPELSPPFVSALVMGGPSNASV